MSRPNQDIDTGNICDSTGVAIGDNNTVIINPLPKEQNDHVNQSPYMMAEKPPSNFIQRHREYNELINCLTIDRDELVTITATLKGAGGFGKTTLAQAICDDYRIKEAFPDGVLWTTLGDIHDQKNLIERLQELYQAMTGQPTQFIGKNEAIARLNPILSQLRCLIVIDDVWNSAHLEPFLQGGDQCARLVTTRIANVVPRGTTTVTVDAMQVNEAIKLLSAELDVTNIDLDMFASLAQRLGEWPLLLNLVNRRLHEDVWQYGSSLTDAIIAVNDELDESGLTAFDLNNAQERNQAVVSSIEVSLKLLNNESGSSDEAMRFKELAIFPEDTAIPVATLALLWQQTGNLDEASTKKLCRKLANLSLVSRYDLQKSTITLHDVIRNYLITQTPYEQLAIWQYILLEGYRLQCDSMWWELPDDNYIYQNLLWHLNKVGMEDELEGLLFTYKWLDAKLQATDIVSLIGDFDLLQDIDRDLSLGLLQHALQMSVHSLVRDKNQLASQLYSRLFELRDIPTIFLKEIQQQDKAKWLQSKTSTLTLPGGKLLYTLSGHGAGVDNLLLAPDDYLISSCNVDDHTIKIWDIHKGVELHSLTGHKSGVNHLLLASDNCLISACSEGDYSIKIWNLNDGRLLYTLELHTDCLLDLLLTPNGHLISSACDNTIKIWDINSGELLNTLKIQSANAVELLITREEYLITSYTDHKLRLWELDNPEPLHTIECDTSKVPELLLTADNRLIFLFNDHTIRIWDINSRSCLHSIDCNTVNISDIQLAADSYLIVSYSDYTINIWDVNTGRKLHTLQGHIDAIDGMLITEDGCLISSSKDNTIKFWDIQSGKILDSIEQTDNISNLQLAPNGYLIFSVGNYSDCIVEIWDIEEINPVYSLNEYMANITNLLLTSSGNLITSCGLNDTINASIDHTVKVWDISRTTLSHSLLGHTNAVYNLLCTNDNRLLSAANNNGTYEVKIWNLDSGMPLSSSESRVDNIDSLLNNYYGCLMLSSFTENMLLITDDTLIIPSAQNHIDIWDINKTRLLHSLEGHTDTIFKLLIMPDGRLVSSSKDNTIKVWNLVDRTLLCSLDEHTNDVKNLLFASNDFLISSSADHELKIWDIEHDSLVYTLEGHTDIISRLLVTADGYLVSSCGSNLDSTIKIWDIVQGKLLYSLDGHQKGISDLLLTPNGYLISSSWDNMVKIWDINAGKEYGSIESNSEAIWKMAWLSDLSYLVTIGGQQLNVWDIEEINQVAGFSADGPLLSCEVAPNNMIIAGDGLGQVHFLELIEPHL